MVAKREPEIPVTPSSGNVFADLGFAEPEDELTKAQIDAPTTQTRRAARAAPFPSLQGDVAIGRRFALRCRGRMGGVPGCVKAPQGGAVIRAKRLKERTLCVIVRRDEPAWRRTS